MTDFILWGTFFTSKVAKTTVSSKKYIKRINIESKTNISVKDSAPDNYAINIVDHYSACQKNIILL